jgi:hypothetical protein
MPYASSHSSSVYVSGRVCPTFSRNDLDFAPIDSDNQAGRAVGTPPEVLKPATRLASYPYAGNTHLRFRVACLEKEERALPEVKKWRATGRVGAFGNHTRLLSESPLPEKIKRCDNNLNSEGRSFILSKPTRAAPPT